MIGQSLWKNLKVLVDIDNQIEQLQEKVDQEKILIDKNKDLIEKSKKEISVLEQKCHNAKKIVDTEELHATELKDKENSKKKALDTVKNQKEYKAFEKEISSISKKRVAQEDILIKAWHEYDLLKKQFDDSIFSQKDKIESITKKIDEQNAVLQEFQNKTDKIIQERKKTEEKIPSDWLAKYNKMRKSVRNPIVPVIGDSCSVCYYAIIRQDLQKLKNNSVLPCRNCYRFLYYDKEEESKENESSF